MKKSTSAALFPEKLLPFKSNKNGYGAKIIIKSLILIICDERIF